MENFMSGTRRSEQWPSRSDRPLIRAKRDDMFDSSRYTVKDGLKSSSPSNGYDRSVRDRFDVDSNAAERELGSVAEQGSRQLTVMVTDDHPIVREGLVALINRRSDMRVIAEASNGRQAVEKYLERDPDVALLDLRMPVMDGIEAVIAISEQKPSARLVMVTSYQCEEDVYRALRSGAQGYVLKDSSVDELVDCIHAVAGGKTWIPSQVGAKLAKHLAYEPLTARETEILRAVTAGKSNKEIGNACNISEATVKVHVTHILEKLKVAGRTEAINVGLKRGLVYLDGAVAT
jgi:DNA-binding NarL/FixJ family response regulator